MARSDIQYTQARHTFSNGVRKPLSPRSRAAVEIEYLCLTRRSFMDLVPGPVSAPAGSAAGVIMVSARDWWYRTAMGAEGDHVRIWSCVWCAFIWSRMCASPRTRKGSWRSENDAVAGGHALPASPPSRGDGSSARDGAVARQRWRRAQPSRRGFFTARQGAPWCAENDAVAGGHALPATPPSRGDVSSARDGGVAACGGE